MTTTQWIGNYFFFLLLYICIHARTGFYYLHTAEDWVWYVLLYPISLPILFIKYVVWNILKYLVLGIRAGVRHTLGKE
jgi:hypothetical protein